MTHALDSDCLHADQRMPEPTTAPPTPARRDSAARPTNSGASKSLRPPYGRPQAQAPAEGGGGGPAGAPGYGAVVAEGGHDQDQHTASAALLRVQRASSAIAARRKPKRRQRDAARKKQCRVTARFDEDEKRQLVEQAATAGLSLAHLVARRALVPGTGPAAASADTASRVEQLDAAIDELVATRSELSAWGNNLNQIARQLNMGGAIPAGLTDSFLTAAERLLHHDLLTAVAHLDDAAHRIAKARGHR